MTIRNDSKGVLRYDFGTLGKATQTGAGALRLPATLTRTGVFEYETAEGTRREYRSPEEVFNPESVESANGVPVTILHPDALCVDSSNVNTLRHGYVVDGVKVEDGFVTGTLQLDTKEVQSRISNGDLVEISMGYRCDLDPTPGRTPEGQEYDVVQRNIRYNHSALGPRSWGRMGPDVRLHVDSGSGVVKTGIRLDSEGRIIPEKKEIKIMKIRIDGQEFVEGSPEHIAYLNEQIRLLTERAEKAEGANAVATKTADEAEEALKKEQSPEKIDEKVEERIDTINTARTIIGEKFDHKGKTNKAIQIEVLTHLDSSFRADSLTDAYIAGAFSFARKNAAKAPAARTDTWKAPVQKQPENPPPAQKRGDGVPAWQRPLAASKHQH